MNLCVCVPGRDSVRAGPRQPASTCKSVRTTCEPWTCLMNSSLLSLTALLKDNTWASNAPQLSSSSSSVVADDSKDEWIQTRQTKPSCYLPIYCKAFHTVMMSSLTLSHDTCNLTYPHGYLSDCTLHYVAAAPITRNRFKL